MILYAAQMISVVEYLTTKNIVHRDIKPENFVLDANYNLKLVRIFFFGCLILYYMYLIYK